MYRKDKPISLKSSTSSLCNNLSVFVNAEKGSLNYAVVHKYLVNIVSSTTDGSQVTNRQVVCKEPSQQGHSMIMQVKWVSLASRTVLVITSIKGIQMFEYDGSAMLYWHSLGDAGAADSGGTLSDGLGQDQDRLFEKVGPDLGPNCFQRLSADDKSCRWQGKH